MRLRLKHQRLLDLLAASPLSQNHWALKVGLSKGHWSEIVNGKSPITPDIAVRLERAFGTPPADMWLRLQAAYDLRQAERRLKGTPVRRLWKATAERRTRAA